MRLQPFVFLGALLLARPAAALDNEFIQEGVVIDGAGNPLPGAHTFRVRLWDNVQNGLTLFDETHVNVNLVEGYYAVAVGSVVPLDPAIFQRAAVYLGITIDNGGELAPRLPLTKVPAAFVADVALDVIGDIHPTSVSIGGALTINEQGEWVGLPTGLTGPQGIPGPRGPAGPAGGMGQAGSPDSGADILVKLQTLNPPLLLRVDDANKLDGFDSLAFWRKAENVDAHTFRGEAPAAFVRTPADVVARLQGLVGTGSGIDVDRIDGLDSSAFVRTRQQVIDLINGVPGTVVGLDADRLDGLNASQFLRSDQNTTTIGTLTAAGLNSTGDGLFLGRVGVGILAPQADLHVVGTLRVDGTIIGGGLDLPPPNDRPKLVFGFDETAGATAVDSSGYGHPGALANAPTRITGVAGRALRFNGSNRVTVTSHADLQPTTALTVMGWVNSFNCGGANGTFVARLGQYGLTTRADCGLTAFVRLAANMVSAPTAAGLAPVGVWTHFALTHDGQTLLAYVDGIERARVAAVGALLAFNNVDLEIGSVSGGGGFQGDVDEVKMFRRTLTPGEILADFTHARPGGGPMASFAAEPSPCDAANAGRFYLDTTRSAIRACTGRTWVTLGSGSIGRSCLHLRQQNAALGSGIYEIDPDGIGGADPFEVFCDMVSDGGGWTKILQYPNSAAGAPARDESLLYTPNVNAIGNIAVVGAPPAFAKLSDARINSIASVGPKIFKISGPDTTSNVYLRTSARYIDTTRAMNMTEGTFQACENTQFSSCVFSNIAYSFVDTLHWGLAGNDCGRYFIDHNGYNTCWPGTNGQRCIQSGSSCRNANHPPIPAATIWVRELVSAGDPPRTCQHQKQRDATSPNGVYRVDPDGPDAGIAAFDVFCDMASDGGGWAKVLQFPNSAPGAPARDESLIYPANSAALGNVAVVGAPAVFSKLSDVQINALGGAGRKIYKISGTDTANNTYLRSSNAYVDTVRAMNMVAGTFESCEQGAVTSCGWSTRTYDFVDTLHWGLAGNDCNRYFIDHNGYNTCWPGTNGQRCIQSGSSCRGANHPPIPAATIWVRDAP